MRNLEQRDWLQDERELVQDNLHEQIKNLVHTLVVAEL